MDTIFLAIICKVFGLKWSEFHHLNGLSFERILDYISQTRELPVNEVQNKAYFFEQERRRWGPLGVLHPAHESYPLEFLDLQEPPVFLSYTGDLNILKRRKMSVIGSRTPQLRFIEWLELYFVEFAKKQSVTVVSGGAMGIDQKASRLAVLAGQETVQILPSGIRSIYPRNLREWQSEKKHLWLSEYLPDQMMMKHHFVVRNRLVAALGGCLFVVQAAQKSGSMMTARYAMNLGRDVATLPDFAGCLESQGNLSLLRDGAQMLVDTQDLEVLFERSGSKMLAPGPDSKNQKETIGQPCG